MKHEACNALPRSSSSVGFFPRALISPRSSATEMEPLPSCDHVILSKEDLR